MQNAKKYNNIKLAFSIGETAATFLLLLIFISSGLSRSLDGYISELTGSNYVRVLIFFLVTGLVFSAIFFPVNFYTGYLLEHKYNLSNQTFFRWIWEGLKSAIVGGAIGIPILLIFYWTLNFFGGLWWLPFACALFFFSVILAQILPVIILPLFYKISPIEDDDIVGRIKRMSEIVGMKIDNVFKFDMSKNTKKANAAFTGLGKTKRVILGDTLLDNFSNDEIETVLAHEFGHYKFRHHIKQIFISALFSFITLYALALLYKISLSWFEFQSITEISALPLLALWGMIIGLIQTPLSNIISRKFEFQADKYAVETSGKKEDFKRTLEKLTDQNLGDKNPHPFVEWFFYSHPSIKNRIAFIESVKI